MAASRWLMCVFVTVLPLRTAARLWDLWLLDAAAKGGASSVPLLSCFALLQLHEVISPCISLYLPTSRYSSCMRRALTLAPKPPPSTRP